MKGWHAPVCIGSTRLLCSIVSFLWRNQANAMIAVRDMAKGCCSKMRPEIARNQKESYFGYVIADQSSVTRTKCSLITSREDVHASRA